MAVIAALVVTDGYLMGSPYIWCILRKLSYNTYQRMVDVEPLDESTTNILLLFANV